MRPLPKIQLPLPRACQHDPGLDSADPEISVLPFISQTAGVPSLFCQRMSAWASALKSPAPTACQAEPGLNPATAPEETLVPFMNQSTGVPSSFCQRMSDLPSA